MRKGFTLVECMLAGAVLCLLSLVLLEGIGVTSRIAHENAELLAADAVVWDAVWKKFNEDFDLMQSQQTERLSREAAPVLYDAASPAELTVTVAAVPGFPDLKSISGDLRWGPLRRRRRLSDAHPVFVYRSNLRRVSW